MANPPRALGRPLDDQAAQVRAAQAAALADPTRLRILSLIATTESGQLSDVELAEALEVSNEDVLTATEALAGVGLIASGSAPSASVHPSVIEVLDEIGVPIAAEFPKPLTDEVVQAADFVVTMGCGDACPVYPGRRYMDWEFADPIGLLADEVRHIRDEIFARVQNLIAEMGLAPLTR